MTKAPKDAQLRVPVERDLRLALEREAVADGRPLANLARKILADYISEGRRYRVDTRERVRAGA